MLNLPDIEDIRRSWPFEVSQPDLSRASYSPCKTAGSIGWWALSGGVTTTHPYLCKEWGCEEHHDQKSDQYVRAFTDFLSCLDSVWVGGFSDGSLDGKDRATALEAIRKRAKRRGLVWVCIQAGGVVVYFASGDLSSRNDSSVAATFTEVTRTQAEEMCRHLLRRLDIKMYGSRTGEPRFLTPRDYSFNRQQGDGAIRKRHIAAIPEGERGRTVQKRIRTIAVGLLPRPVTDAERENLIERGKPPEGLANNTGAEWAAALEEAGGLYKAERRDQPSAPPLNEWPSAPGRHLQVLPTDPGEEQESDQETAA